MEKLGKNRLWSFVDRKANATRIEKATEITASKGHRVENYLELARKVAELQFLNPAHVLLFRGQSIDHKNRAGNSTIKPTIFRAVPSEPTKLRSNPPPDGVVIDRFERLRRAENLFLERYEAAGWREWSRVKRQRILRWAVLQHYEVCGTPLLDVTQSLRIAASFASFRETEEAFLYVLAVPNISGSVTASIESGVQVLRLASVCPPSAIRPHVQEGYLIGEYPDLVDFNQKALYPHDEIDFGRRLIAKFRFCPQTFWKANDPFPKIPYNALYPSSTDDPLQTIADGIKSDIKQP